MHVLLIPTRLLIEIITKYLNIHRPLYPLCTYDSHIWSIIIFIKRSIHRLVKFQVVVDQRSPTSTKYYIQHQWSLWIMHIFRDMSGWVIGWHVALTGCKLDTKNAPPSVLRHDSCVLTVTRVVEVHASQGAISS